MEMITRENYLKALDIIEEYHNQLKLSNIKRLREQLNPGLERNDCIEYIGGSESKYLTIGKKYRLTGVPWGNLVSIINDNNKRMRINQRYFKDV